MKVKFSGMLAALPVAFLFTLAGCSRDYMPPSGAEGKDIFLTACIECHEPLEGQTEYFYQLTVDNMNVDYVSNKITSGSLMMPKFPNISGSELKAISEYVLSVSTQK